MILILKMIALQAASDGTEQEQSNMSATQW